MVEEEERVEPVGRALPDEQTVPSSDSLEPVPLGVQLKDARLALRYKLEDVEQATKVRCKHLEAIEEGQFKELPPDVFAVGFVRRYARFLNLDPEVAATMFRRERAAKKEGKKPLSFAVAHSPMPPRFILSTKLILSFFVGLAVLLLFGYIWYQVRLFAAAPHITLTSPADQTVAIVETITIMGMTSPTATLTVNNEPVPLDEEGGFRQDVKLNQGVNAIEIKAANRLGKEATQTIHVLYEETPPLDLPAVTPPPVPP